jgi:hypothetical protein
MGCLAPGPLPTVGTDPAPRSEEPESPVLRAPRALPSPSGHWGLESTYVPKKEAGSR